MRRSLQKLSVAIKMAALAFLVACDDPEPPLSPDVIKLHLMMQGVDPAFVKQLRLSAYLGELAPAASVHPQETVLRGLLHSTRKSLDLRPWQGLGPDRPTLHGEAPCLAAPVGSGGVGVLCFESRL
jgi:hypothetical protein